MGEQLQHADKLPGPRAWSEPRFEVASKRGVRGRELPVAVDRGVVERRRLALQSHQEMQGIEQLLAAAVAPLVRGNDLPVGHHLDVIDVALHGHGRNAQRRGTL